MNLVGLTQTELVSLASDLGEKPFRGKQLYRQIYHRKIYDLAGMTDLSQGFRDRLASDHSVETLQVQRRQDSSDGTVKFLFRLADGEFIESVYIPEDHRETLCISSQVGCAVGCTFCLTAQMGFRRNLSAGEIVAQVLSAIRHQVLRREGFNVVFMGMGEPLYNYKNVMKAFRIMTDPAGMNLSHRRITVSTSGIVPVLERMQGEHPLPNLAISLNATTDSVRRLIMPVNDKWPLESLLDACRKFPLEPRRRITFEYVLLDGQNDRVEDARRLVRLLSGIPAKINLIPYNANPGLPHRRPGDDRVERFRRILVDSRVSAFVRRTRGHDISAACGQLAHLSDAPAASAGDAGS